MTRQLFSYLLAWLLLGAGACTHKDPEPAPTLEGSWALKSTETIAYKADGSIETQLGVMPTANPSTYLFTAATLTITTTAYNGSYTYSRANDVLTLTPTGYTFPLSFTRTITELTTTTLRLQDQNATPTGGYAITYTQLGRF
jgi:hypothetical protein